MDRIKVIIADDKPGYRNLVSEMLEPAQINVVGEAENGRQLLELLRRQHTHILLLDLDMPVMDGNKAFDLISERFPDVKVVILSFYADQSLVEHYMGRGAKGYIPKDLLEPSLLQDALNAIHKGGTYTPFKPREKKVYSPRQKEMMPLLFEGLTNKEIAEELCIGERAVEKQRQKIYQKGGAVKAIDFYKYAFTRGLQFLGRAKDLKKNK